MVEGTYLRRTRIGLAGALTVILVLLASVPAFAETEPNNGRTSASPITLGVAGDRSSAINPAGEVDWFTFSAPRAGTYTVEAFDVADGLQLFVDGYDGAGTKIASRTAGSGRSYSRVVMRVSAAGTYFVKAYPLYSTQSGTYSIRVLPQYDQGLTWDSDREPNDTLWTAPAVSVGVSGAVATSIVPLSPSYESAAADQDWFRFTAGQAGTYTVEAFNVTDGLQVFTDGYDKAGNRIASRVAGSGQGYSRAVMKISIPGTYFVRAYPLYSSQSGTYSIRVLPQYDQGLTWDVNREPNDTLWTAAALSVGVGGAIATSVAPLNPSYEWAGADQDWFRFSAPRAGTYTVEAFNVANGLQLYVEGYDKAGNRIASRARGTGNVYSRAVVKVSIAGTYFVRAYPLYTRQSGTYSVRVLPQYDQGLTWDANREPNDTLWTAAAISVGAGGAIGTSIPPLNPAFASAAADEDWFRFTAATAGTYTAEAFNVPSGLQLYLEGYDKAGNRIAYRTAGSGGVYSRAVINVSIPGTYFVRAYPLYSSQSGSYSVRIV